MNRSNCFFRIIQHKIQCVNNFNRVIISSIFRPIIRWPDSFRQRSNCQEVLISASFLMFIVFTQFVLQNNCPICIRNVRKKNLDVEKICNFAVRSITFHMLVFFTIIYSVKSELPPWKRKTIAYNIIIIHIPTPHSCSMENLYLLCADAVQKWIWIGFWWLENETKRECES